MTANNIKFAVHIMPAPQPRNPHLAANLNLNKPLRTMRLGFKPSQKFSEVWQQIQLSYDSAYAQDERDSASFSRIQDFMEADIILSDTVGSLYDNATPQHERVLYVRQVALDQQSSLPPGSHLQPEGYSKRNSNDLTPERLEAVKRRRIEESTFGAAVRDLDADTPVASRESAEGGAGDVGRANKDAKMVENGGFVVPPRPVHVQQQVQRRQARQESQADVLVMDSQPQQHTVQPGSAASALRQRRNVSNHAPNSDSLTSSSPAAAAGARANPLVAPSRQSALLPAHTATAGAAITPARQNPIPTPDSDERRRSSNEAPTSGQRPRSSHAPASERAHSFLRNRTTSFPEAQQDITLHDPIEDEEDDLYGLTDGEEDKAKESARGRVRSRSIDTVPQPQRSDTTEQPATSQNRPSDDSAFAPSQNNKSDLHVDNAFDHMAASQIVNDRSGSANGKWTHAENQSILLGIKKNWNPKFMIEKGNLNRSESAVRNRRNGLRKDIQMGKVSLADVVEIADSGNRAINEDSGLSSSQRQNWTTDHMDKLRQAIAQGYGAFETRQAYFPTRSEESVSKKFRELEPLVLRSEKLKATFPKDDGEAAGWTDVHSNKLRRLYHDANMTEQDGYRRWFQSFAKNVVKRKLAAYQAQMTEYMKSGGIASQATNGTSSGARDSTLPEDPDSQIVVLADTPAPAQTAALLSSQLLSEADVDSSPPEAVAENRRSTPAVVVTTAEQQSAVTNARQISRTSSNGGQSKLAFERLKRKGRAESGTSIADIDSEFSRTSSRRQSPRPGQTEAQPNLGGEGEPIVIGSDREESSEEEESSGEQDMFSGGDLPEKEQAEPGKEPYDIDLSDTAADDWVRLSEEVESELQSQIDSQLQIPAEDAPVIRVQEVSTTTPRPTTQSQPAPEVRNHVQSQPEQDSNEDVSKTAEPPTQEQDVSHPQRIPNSHETAPQAAERSRRAPPGRLPQTNGYASRFQRLTQRNLRPSRLSTDSASRALPRPQRRPQHLSTHRPRPQQGPMTTLTLVGGSDDSTTQSQSQSQVVSTPQPAAVDSSTQSESQSQIVSQPQPVGIVEPWIPFENRSVNEEGEVDVGRPGFPHLMLRNHPWVRSENEMWTEAQQKAKPEWVQDMYDYIKDDCLRLIRIAAKDDHDATRLRLKMLRARKLRRANMGLPSLHTLRKPKLWAPGMPEPTEDDDDRGSDYEPDFYEDDEKDFVMMLKDELRVAEEHDSDDEDQHPDGIDHDRHFSDVEDEEEEDDSILAIKLPNGHVTEVEDEDEDFGLPTAPPAGTMEDSSAPTDAQLQDLVQSGDVEMYDDSRSFVRTRPNTAGSISPNVEPTSPKNPVANSQRSAAFGLDGADERNLDATTARNSSRRNTRTNRNRFLTDSMLPPPAASREHGTSLERSTSSKYNFSSEAQVQATSQTSVPEAEPDVPEPPSVARSRVRRRLVEDDIEDDEKVVESKRKKRKRKQSQAGGGEEEENEGPRPKKKKKKKKKRVKKVDDEEASEEATVESKPKKPKKSKKQADADEEAVEEDKEEIAPRKRKKLKRRTVMGNEVATTQLVVDEQPEADEQARAYEEARADEQLQPDQVLMPPPALVPETRQAAQQQRSDSFDSQITTDTTSSRTDVRSDGTVRSRRASRRHRRRENRMSLDNSMVESTTGEVVVMVPMTQSQQLDGAADDEDEDMLVSPVTALETQEIPDSIEYPRLPTITSPSLLASSDSLPQIGTPVGEPQSDPFVSNGDTSSSRGGGIWRRVWGSWGRNIPPAPKQRELTPQGKVKMPYATDDEDSSSTDSD